MQKIYFQTKISEITGIVLCVPYEPCDVYIRRLREGYYIG